MSWRDMDELDPEILRAVYIFDTFIEPKGERYEMIKYTNTLYTIFMSNPNLTKEARKKIKPTDWDYLNIINHYPLTMKEKAVRLTENSPKAEQNKAAVFGAWIKGIAKDGKK